MMDWGVVIQIVSIVGSVAGTYAVIRSDIRVMMSEIAHIKAEHSELRMRFNRHVEGTNKHTALHDHNNPV